VKIPPALPRGGGGRYPSHHKTFPRDCAGVKRKSNPTVYLRGKLHTNILGKNPNFVPLGLKFVGGKREEQKGGRHMGGQE